MLGHLRDVNETLDPLGHGDERPERHELGDLAADDVAGGVLAGEHLPGVFLAGLQREADPLALHVHVEDLHLDLVAHLHDGPGVVDVLPGELGDVHEAVHAAEIDEGAEVHDAGHDALAHLTGRQRREEGVALLGLRLLEPGPPRQDDVVAVLVELDDLALEVLAHVGLQITHTAQLDERGGQEPAETDVEDEPALDDLDDGAGDDTAFFLDGLDLAPRPLVLGALLGELQAAVLVLFLEDEGFDLFVERHDLAGVDVVADRELLGGDDAFGLVADVEEDFVLVDPHDLAADYVTVVEGDDGRFDGCGEVVGCDVVIDDLPRLKALCECAATGHVVVCHVLVVVPSLRFRPGGRP